jgi:hypothetical protein
VVPKLFGWATREALLRAVPAEGFPLARAEGIGSAPTKREEAAPAGAEKGDGVTKGESWSSRRSNPVEWSFFQLVHGCEKHDANARHELARRLDTIWNELSLRPRSVPLDDRTFALDDALRVADQGHMGLLHEYPRAMRTLIDFVAHQTCGTAPLVVGDGEHLVNALTHVARAAREIEKLRSLGLKR